MLGALQYYDSGGDITLVDEVCRNRGLQEDLAVQEPDHPMRAFGEAVEAASGSGGPVAEQLTRACMDEEAGSVQLRALSQLNRIINGKLQPSVNIMEVCY